MTDIQKALRRYSPAPFRDHLEAAERERVEIQRRFPLERWPEMPLEDYALGQNRPNEQIYSWWLEFGSSHLGSMRGGTSSKHLIYKKKDGSGWFLNGNYANEQVAWDAIRGGFVEMFSLAHEGRWQDIDAVEPISGGRALRLKSLHVYFRDQILPIGSVHHIRHFLDLLNVEPTGIRNWQAVKLSRMLLEKLREYPETQNWTTNELERFLYWWNDPRVETHAPQIVKIASGEEGRYWPDCLENGYIRVGWAKVGDLREYESEADFRTAFESVYYDEHKGHRQTPEMIFDAAITK